MRQCSVTGCNRAYYSRNFCQHHYDKNRRHGDPLFVEKIAKGSDCTVGGCHKPIISNKFCGMHNRRFLRHGDPNFINPKCNRDGKYKERHREYVKRWKKENWPAYRAYLKSRKQRVKQATPKWADLNAIKDFYFHCPVGHHVDHIVPLNGRIVSGLHVMNNLQYLSEADNLKKSNL